MLGPRLGLLAAGGNLLSTAKTSDYQGGALDLGLEGGFRFARRFYVGLQFDHGFTSAGSLLSNVPGVASVTVASNYLGVDFVYISNPDGVGFYGEVGLGYRGTGFSIGDSSVTLSGGEAELGVGVHVKVGEWVRLVPKISFAAGQYSNQACSGNVAGPLSCSASNSTISDTDTHTFVFFGAVAFFDFARKH